MNNQKIKRRLGMKYKLVDGVNIDVDECEEIIRKNIQDLIMTDLVERVDE